MAASALSAGLQADAFQRIYPAEYFAKFAEQGVRPDGRPLALPRCADVCSISSRFKLDMVPSPAQCTPMVSADRPLQQRQVLTAPRLAVACCRPTSIGLGVVSTADASALVKMGSTTVLAGLKCEIMPASSEAPDEGRWMLQVGEQADASLFHPSRWHLLTT